MVMYSKRVSGWLTKRKRLVKPRIKESWRSLKLRNVDRINQLRKVPGLNRLSIIAQPNISVSESQIQKQLEKQFPIKRQYLVLFSMTIEHPRIVIHGVDDKFSVGVDIKIHLSDVQAKVFHGKVDIDVGVDFDRGKGLVYLTDPRIASFQVKGMSDSISGIASTLLNEAVLNKLDRFPIYQLESSSRRQRAIQKMLKDIRLGEGELILDLGF